MPVETDRALCACALHGLHCAAHIRTASFTTYIVLCAHVHVACTSWLRTRYGLLFVLLVYIATDRALCAYVQAVRTSWLRLLEHLVTVKSTFLQPCIDRLVKSFLPTTMLPSITPPAAAAGAEEASGARTRAWAAHPQVTVVHTALCASLAHLISHVPRCAPLVRKAVAQCLPHKLQVRCPRARVSHLASVAQCMRHEVWVHVCKAVAQCMPHIYWECVAQGSCPWHRICCCCCTHVQWSSTVETWLLRSA